MLSNIGPSIIRTIVPYLVALIGPWVLRNLGVDEAHLSAGLTILVGALLYVAARLLEQVAPRFGWLLGWPAQPTYARTTSDGSPDITSLPDGAA